MAYEPLDEAKNEIRVLQFEDRWHPESLQEHLRMSIKNVSLNEFSEEYRLYGRRSKNKSLQIWQDPFSQVVELRRSVPDLKPLQSTATDHTPGPTSRFAWGDYEALSYAWGDEKQKGFIWLNGNKKKVSPNLEAALRALHRLPETQLKMKYWIDALCINQEDNQEKSHQVKRMKEIYSVARTVIVWLGAETKEDDRAIRTMVATRRDASQNGRLLPPPDFDTEDWSSLCAFMRKPYWNRLWIIQELAANQNSTLFLCGDRELTREMVKMAVDCCQKLIKEEAMFTRNAELDARSISSRIYTLVDLKSDLPPDAMLRKALKLARQATASDERDKAYGVLGLLQESISSRIEPDYGVNKLVQHVFTELIMAIIQATGNLEQIIYGARSSAPEWPSWVPDLRIPFLRHHNRYLRQSRASNDIRAEYRFLNEQDVTSTRLCAKGIELDFVDGIAASSSSDDLPIYPSHNPNRYGSNMTQIIGRTLLMDHPKARKYPALMELHWCVESEKSLSAYQESIWTGLHDKKDFQDFQKFQKKNQNFPVNGRYLRACFPVLPRKLKNSHVVLYHMRLATISLQGRRLVTTNTGHICLVPEAVQKGDVVVILLGCNFPVLLRQYGKFHRVLGECYVHGFMNGEIFVAQRRDNLPYQDFILT